MQNLLANTGDKRDSGLIPGSGIPRRARAWQPLQYSCLGNPMDRGAWQATVHGVAQGRTRLSDLARTRMQKCAVTF